MSDTWRRAAHGLRAQYLGVTISVMRLSLYVQREEMTVSWAPLCQQVTGTEAQGSAPLTGPWGPP